MTQQPHSDEGALSRAAADGALRARRPRLAGLIAGGVALAGLIAFILHVGEIGAFADSVKKAAPEWLALALAAQAAAFLAQAFVWAVTLHRRSIVIPRASLFSLSIGKLFADQAIPSAGISGGVFFIHALTVRGVSGADAFTAFVFGAASFIAAFLVFSFAALGYLTMSGAALDGPRIEVTDLHFLAIASLLLLFVIGAIYAVSTGRTPIRSTSVGHLAQMARQAFRLIYVEKLLFAQCFLLQSAARLFDIVTLWIVFRSLGVEGGFIAAFAGVSLGSLAATVAPTPMGLGSFEAGLIGALAALGLAVEPGLAATLLYRGLSLGLPIAIGFFIVQRELLRK